MLLSLDLVVAARPAEDAAGGRRPAAVRAAAARAHACVSKSRDPVPFTVILLAAVARRPRLSGANIEYVILVGSLLSRTKTVGRVAVSLCILSAPLDEVQPSASCWGSPGATPGRGCVRFPLSQIAQLRAP
jgi:hypothetical protein